VTKGGGQKQKTTSLPILSKTRLDAALKERENETFIKKQKKLKKQAKRGENGAEKVFLSVMSFTHGLCWGV